MKTTMHLPDFFDRNLLQTLQNTFALLAGTTVAAVDPQGILITIPSDGRSPHENVNPAMAAERTELSPAAVMVYSADAWIGQWIIGGARPLAASPDVRSLIFMPMETDGAVAGFLGFDRQTLRDWQPETLALFWELGTALAENLGGKNIIEEGGGAPSRFGPVYGKSAPQQSVSA